MNPNNTIRNTRQKNDRLAAQQIAVNTLHTETDGACAHCGVPFPCATRSVSRMARRLVSGDSGTRMDPRTAGETAVTRYLEDSRAATDCAAEGQDR